MNNPASNFGATPAGGVYEGKPHGSVADSIHPKVEVLPGRCWGQPTLEGTRIPVDMIAGVVAHHGYEEAEQMYEISRAQAYVCCWFVAEFQKRTKLGKHFKQWAEDNFKAMWNGHYDEVTEPKRISR